MLKSESQNSIKQLQAESASLSPSALINLFIIDITDIALDMGIINTAEVQNTPNLGIFRFHNNIKLFNSSIYWQGFEYLAIPIEAVGFEYSSEGTLPRPKISLTISDQGISEFTRLKTYLLQIGDLVGAKFTRIRTFAKYLDAQNFVNNISFNESSPDPNAEFPREIYYFDRKSKEDKYSIEYELSTIFDLEGLKLPGRLVMATCCAFQYRGEGCKYEFANRRTSIHGDSTLPLGAPPVANNNDELITDMIGGLPLIDRGEFQTNTPYSIGNYVFIQKNNIKYYYVASAFNHSVPPPDRRYWIADTCSRFVSGCKLRYGTNGSAVVTSTPIVKGRLPFGGYPSTNKLLQG